MSTRRPACAPPPKIWIIGIGILTGPPSAITRHSASPPAAAAACNAAIETAIVAWRDGVIKALHVSPGQTFDRAAPLVTLEAKGEE